jgi:hypothetical protein
MNPETAVQPKETKEAKTSRVLRERGGLSAGRIAAALELPFFRHFLFFSAIQPLD